MIEMVSSHLAEYGLAECRLTKRHLAELVV